MDYVIFKILYVIGFIVFNCYIDFKKGVIFVIGLNYKGGNNWDIVCDGCFILFEFL